MDNPWANAWDESKASSTPPPKSLAAENETDIAIPSWSAGPAVSWNEPSDDAPPLWQSASDAPSTFDPKGASWTSSYASMSAHFSGSTISLDTETETEAEKTAEGSEQEEQDEQSEDESNIADPWTLSRPKILPSVDVTSSAVTPVLAPASPDALEFGSFESGADSPAAAAEATWDTSSNHLQTADSEWGPVWVPKAQPEREIQEEQVLDEWERSRRDKERMDRLVPPELLASILRTLDDISDDLLTLPNSLKPKDPKGMEKAKTVDVENSPKDTADEGTETSLIAEAGSSTGTMEKEKARLEKREAEENGAWKDPIIVDGSLNHWKDGMDIVQDLSSLRDTLIRPLPPLSSLPAISSQFNSHSQSFISKRSLEAVRLTRSTLISYSGPLGMYLKTKGSIEWEVAVKARPSKTSEEEREESVPVGWRIVQKEERKKVEAPEMKRRGTGILSSFFGRRAATPPVELKESTDATPRPSLTSSTVNVDSAPSKIEAQTEFSSPKIFIPPVPASAPSTTVTSPVSSTSVSSNYADIVSLDLFQDEPVTAPAPSAVSRFLTRFSRNRPSHSRTGSNSSLALSTNDLEFLEDIVPSVADKDDHDTQNGSGLLGFQDLISSAPLPAPLPPPPNARPQLSINRKPDIISGPEASQIGSPLNFTYSAQILTPSPAVPSQIQTSIIQPSAFQSRSSTPSSFASPLSRASSPGSDMLNIATSLVASRISSQSTGASARGGTGFGLSQATSTSSTKKPTPVAIMSSDSHASSNSSFSFLPPPPSIRQPGGSTKAIPSLLIDETTRAFPTLTVPASTAALSVDSDDDDFSDFHSGVAEYSSRSSLSAQLSASSSAQPLFSAGSTAFTDSRTSSARPLALDENIGGTDSLNTSVSSITSTHSATTMLQPLSGDLDLFRDFGDSFDNSAGYHAPLRTPSPPAPPTKFSAKLADGSGLGGRVAPGRLILPPISAAAYSRNWDQRPSSGLSSSNDPVSSATPFTPSASEPVLAALSFSSPDAGKSHQRRVSKEAHQRTRSLVEEGIARSGVWPSSAPRAVPTSGYGSAGVAYGAFGYGTAPPLTPLPPILSPPPESGPSKGRDLLGGGGEDDDDDVPLASLTSGTGSVPNSSVFANQQQSLRQANGDRNGILPPIPLPGPSLLQISQPTPSLLDFGAFESGMSPNSSAVNLMSTAKTSTTGALSAQDLSFFEGL
ncbi:hypothetical protein D9757_012100 [Collybiopsis confluens]|uniref:Uncharacterized protein n=1 Tax=Collybiopsis confluens TaxID=2823264 RepID=A0A8H5D3D5_9AGAR|nr:hypothetical protein D9757_012100 [Collybiopsis confluens]